MSAASGFDEEEVPLGSQAAEEDDYAGYDPNDPAYKKFHEEADVDDRLGKHTFVVDTNTREHWPDGRVYRKLKGRLITASYADCDATMSVPEKPADLEKLKATGQLTRNRKRGIDLNNQMHEQLMRYYKVTPSQVQVGNRFCVEVGKQADKKSSDRDKYYIRIVAFHAPDGIQAKTDDEVPF